MSLTPEGRAIENFIARSEIPVSISFEPMGKYIEGRKVNGLNSHDGSLVFFNPEVECRLTWINVQFDDCSYIMVENTIHEFWHTLSLLANPCGYLREAYEDRNLKHDNKRAEAGSETDPGAIQMGKVLGHATQIELDIIDGVNESLKNCDI